MLDPIQAYNISTHTPSQGYSDLNEEQFAQRHGRAVVCGRPLWSRVSVRMGKLLIRIGEKLAAENTSIEWSKDIA